LLYLIINFKNNYHSFIVYTFEVGCWNWCFQHNICLISPLIVQLIAIWRWFFIIFASKHKSSTFTEKILICCSFLCSNPIKSTNDQSCVYFLFNLFTFLFFHRQISNTSRSCNILLEFRANHMSSFKIINVVLSYSRALWWQIFNFIEIVYFMFWYISTHLWICSFWSCEIACRSWRWLIFISINNSIGYSFSWIFIHLSRKRTILNTNIIDVGSGYTFFDFEYIINIVSFMFWFS